MPISRSADKKPAVAAHDDSNEVSTNGDFNTMMGKKLNEFKLVSSLKKFLKISKYAKV